MAGSLNTIYDNISFALSIHADIMNKLQEQVATGSKVNRASDAPSDAYQILGLKSQTKLLENYLENLSTVLDTLEVSSTVIDSMAESINNVRTMISQVTSGIYDEESRERTAEQIDDVLEQMLLLANTKHNGQYIFAGGSSGTAPYLADRTDGKITSITYQAASVSRSVEVAPGMQYEIYYVADSLFRSDNRQQPIFSGDTGAKNGSGTSSVTGDVWMTVIHDGSNYKISIDDGLTYTTVPSGGDTNQAVTDSRTGKVLYVDTTELNSTGIELVRVPGTYDLFNTLISIRDTFTNERGLSDEQIKLALRDTISTLEEVSNLILQANVSIGAKIGFLDDLKQNITEIKYSSEDRTTELEEADITQIAIELSRREVLYEMSLSIAAKILSTSLLDFI